MQTALILLFAISSAGACGALGYSFAELAAAWPLLRRAALLALVEG